MNLNDINEIEPPKDEPFLALTTSGFEAMEWVQRVVNGEHKGWYAFYAPCCCCYGNCTTSFQYWMPMPKIAFQKQYNLWNKIIEEMPKGRILIIANDLNEQKEALQLQALLNAHLESIRESEEPREYDSSMLSSEAKSE